MALVDNALGVRPLRADAERNRQRILAAAEQVFSRRGLSAGLDEVARQAGVGIGTVYRRFPDKHALILALAERRVATMLELGRRCAAMPDSWRGLEEFVTRAVEMQVADRALKELLFTSGPDPAMIARAKAEIEPMLAGLLTRAQADGHVRPDIEVTDLPVLQLMLDAAATFGADVKPDLWHRFLGILLDGLRTARTGPTPLAGPALTDDEVELACTPVISKP